MALDDVINLFKSLTSCSMFVKLCKRKKKRLPSGRKKVLKHDLSCPVAKLLSDKVHMKSHLLWMKGSNGGHGDRGQCETKSECGANIFRHSFQSKIIKQLSVGIFLALAKSCIKTDSFSTSTMCYTACLAHTPSTKMWLVTSTWRTLIVTLHTSPARWSDGANCDLV